MARALSSSEKERIMDRVKPRMCDPAAHHVGQNIHAFNKIELLEDHRAGRAPEAQIGGLSGP